MEYNSKIVEKPARSERTEMVKRFPGWIDVTSHALYGPDFVHGQDIAGYSIVWPHRSFSRVFILQRWWSSSNHANHNFY